ncbi:glycoprotein endo-alpha-1,2-mannosidase-like [Histomonas meleagridis]|uniref:glycoprotein endo-alpha-1,2-mannosidase-like n=1 Tax=Histomonas meleagridis TaxID=135588 RepID=UPI00355ABC83|nr:glycoprotein endo-alpha-1,2-mannosidase-like [Histomonas meleagridis]KAH0799254.1 glycoprotein endo-alpha-1,2-mannosidase-like [Histomonas meleagridis]
MIYSGSYGNIPIDGRWVGWKVKRNSYFDEYYELPSRLPSPLFPAAGLYSSHDPSLIRQHLYQMHCCGVDSVILLWSPPSRIINNDNSTSGFSDKTLEILLDAASEFQITATVQIPQYDGRSNQTIFEDFQYLYSKYAHHPSYLHIHGNPVVLIYDPHEINYLYHSISESHNKGFNFYFIGSVVTQNHIGDALETGFDSVYSYFASESFTYCSNISHWKSLVTDSQERNISFFPTVGPGYDNEKVDVWNHEATRSRENGLYYDRMWNAAIETSPKVIIVNSFNNWMEGTQIETAINKKGFEFNERNWCQNGDANEYIERTKKWVKKYKEMN